MHAAVLEAYDRPVVLTEVPDPVPAEGEVLIRVRAVGICGTDVKVTTGLIPNLPLPLIPGHEVAGELLADVGGLRAGQRVAAYIFQPCGVCQWCRRGQQTICATSPRLGFERDGGLAEYLVMRPQDLLPFSDDLDFAQAAVTMDAVLTPWHALRSQGDVREGDTVVIVGAGGLGLHGVQIAAALGARVAVVDVDPGRREFALKLGAEQAVGPEDTPGLASWTGEGADVVLEASGAPAGFRVGMDLVRPGGTVVVCGYKPGSDLPADSMRVALSEITVVGSRSGSVTDARDALRAVEEGRISPLIADTGVLADVPAFLERTRQGGVLGRMVVRL